MIYKSVLAAVILGVGYLQQNSESAASYIASAVQNTKTAIINDDTAYFESELINPANAVIEYAQAASVRKASAIASSMLIDIDLDALYAPDELLDMQANTTKPMPVLVNREFRELGTLSAKYESRGNAGAIGHDNTGGWSYGRYQIATKVGTMQNFMSWLKTNHHEYYQSLNAAGGAKAALNGSDGFKQAWKQLAKDHGFSTAQHEFIADTHYVILARKLRRKGLAVDSRSHALRDVVWSAAVQHGGNTDVFDSCLGVKQSDDATLIKCSYAVRATRFTRSTARVRAAVKSRFVQEEKQALAML